MTMFFIVNLVIGMLILWFGLRIVRPTHRGLVERFGKYQRFANPGFNWVFPLIERMVYVNITEQMADVNPQDIITKDNLNARVDLMVYYKVKLEEENVKKSVYNVEYFEKQIISLAQTTARNVIGDMTFVKVNSQRNELNAELAKVLDKESDAWGVQIVRVELKEITPPSDVQETMNKVIKAQNERDAAVDFATAVETQADGARRANIKEAEGKKQAEILQAEGIRQSKILQAQGQAEAIKLVNEAAEKYFKGPAKDLKQLEVTQASLESNSKIIIAKDGINPQLLIGQLPITQMEVK